MGTKGVSVGVKRPEREDDGSPSFSAEVWSVVDLYLHFHMYHHGVVLN
jgi:hypothetical protein